jgi:hypothetical protein
MPFKHDSRVISSYVCTFFPIPRHFSEFSSAGAFSNEPGYVFTLFILIPLLDTKITGIDKHALFLTVEKVAIVSVL